MKLTNCNFNKMRIKTWKKLSSKLLLVKVESILFDYSVCIACEKKSCCRSNVQNAELIAYFVGEYKGHSSGTLQ